MSNVEEDSRSGSHDGSASGAVGLPSSGGGSGGGGAGLTVRVGDAGDDLVGDAMASTRCAELASLAEQADIRCLCSADRSGAALDFKSRRRVMPTQATKHQHGGRIYLW